MKAAKLLLLAIAIFGISCANNQTATNEAGPAMSSSPAAVATPTPDEFAAARTNYEKQCSACHGENGEGGLVKVDDKRLKVPTLKAGHAVTHTDEQLVKQVTDGGDGMPAFKDKLRPEEITELVKFVRHEFQKK